MSFNQTTRVVSCVGEVMLLKWTFRLFSLLKINPLLLTREKGIKTLQGRLLAQPVV